MKSSDLNTGYWTDSAFQKQRAQTAALFLPKYLYLLNPTFPVAKEILKALLEQRCQSQGQGSLKDTKQRTTEVQSQVDVGTLFRRATTGLEAKGFQMRMDLKAQAVSLTEEVRKTPWKDGGQSRECLFMATAAAMFRNYTGVGRVTGWKKNVIQLIHTLGRRGYYRSPWFMIAWALEVWGSWRNVKRTAIEIHLLLSWKVSTGNFHSWDKLSPALAGKTKTGG